MAYLKDISDEEGSLFTLFPDVCYWQWCVYCVLVSSAIWPRLVCVVLLGWRDVGLAVWLVLVGQSLAACEPDVVWPGGQGRAGLRQSLTSLRHGPLHHRLLTHQIPVWKVRSKLCAAFLTIVILQQQITAWGYMNGAEDLIQSHLQWVQ